MLLGTTAHRIRHGADLPRVDVRRVAIGKVRVEAVDAIGCAHLRLLCRDLRS